MYSIGSPKGLELTISEGLVSAVRSTPFGDIVQTSAAISHGSSGGGLFNLEGELVGLTTFFLKDGQNLNFAVPAVAAVNLLQELEPSEAQRLAAVRAAADSQRQLRDSAMSAVAAASAGAASPRPKFDSVEQRLAYLRWLGSASERLKPRKPETAMRIEFLETLWYESTRAGLEPALVLGLVEVASNFGKYAIAASGARGYMQVAPVWANKLGDGDVAKLFHLQTNLRYGCVLLRHYIDEGRGDLPGALVHYYGQSVGRAVRLTDPAGVAFVKSVLAARQRWTA